MKVSYEEGLANHFGLQRRGGSGDRFVLSVRAKGMNAKENSDESIVPATTANNGGAEPSAESIEERDSAKRNGVQADLLRTPGRIKRKSSGLHGVREAARKDSTPKFTALLHHVNVERLTEAFFNLKKTAAVGIDQVTWHEYGRNVEANIVDLHERIHRGAYADDFVLGFEHHDEATRCLEELQSRLAKFGLKRHKDKTRLIEFGKYAIERRERRGDGRPETFNFLGFTHQCARTKKHGWFTIHRHSIAKRVRATLAKIKENLQKRRHRPLGENGRWLRSVVQGWLNYHAVPGNSQCLSRFVDEVTRLWLATIRRRSQRGSCNWTWARMQQLARLHLPRPRVIHPYPNQRFRARLKAGAV